MSFKNVIAAVDFSSVSARVLEHAFAIGSKVHLVHAFSLSELSESTLRAGTTLPEAHAVAERELRKLAELHLPSGRVGQVIVREGDPASTLAKIAEDLGADLIVVDTHHRGLARLVHGSVAERLVRDAACAVLVLRS